jgi:hypothetical protein
MVDTRYTARTPNPSTSITCCTDQSPSTCSSELRERLLEMHGKLEWTLENIELMSRMIRNEALDWCLRIAGNSDSLSLSLSL